ncbi:hypothetical protein MMC30_001873 [Trapelia coarctata]|nr:hypothetical protein [Trapelia coarctata]
MDIDPRLRETSQEDFKPYSHHSAQSALYTLNPIHLPSSQQRSTGLPPLRQEIGPPYYNVQQQSRPQNDQPTLPASQPHDHTPSLQPVHDFADLRNELKRPRACEACRGLKVRCVPGPDGKCKRCAKAGRPCFVTAPSRKRQKKSDSRVEELEKKIDALTASLQATKNQQMNGSESETSEDGHNREIHTSSSRTGLQSQQPHDASSLQGPESVISGTPVTENWKRRWSAHQDTKSKVESGGDTTYLRNGNVTLHTTVTGKWSTQNTDTAEGPSADDFQDGQGYIDVIDRQLLDAETAARLFHHYMENMSHHMPAVVFPSATNPNVIRREKPTLFLAILSVAAGSYPDLQKVLQKEVIRRYADCLICKNSKSLDTIQALQISSIWYAPEEFKDAKPYQLILMATTMAIAMGLGQLGRPMGAFSLGWKELRHASKASIDELSMAERRRAWVSCYVLCGLTAMALRLPNLLRWNSYLEECIQGFETSPVESDKILGKWAKLQRLKDNIALQYEVEDAFGSTGPTSLDAEKNLSALREQLDQWERESHTSSASLSLAFHVSRMHMFHIRVRLSYCLDAVEEPHPLSDDHKTVKSWDVPAPSEVDTVQKFIRSIHKVIEEFLSFTITEVRTIPTFHFLRAAYAVICLLRLDRGAKKPDSELGKLIYAGDLEVDTYIARLLKLMQSAAADGKSRPAQTFQSALTTIKTWFKPNTECPCGEDDATDHAIKPQPVDTETDMTELGNKKTKFKNDEPSKLFASEMRPQHRQHQEQELIQQYQPPVPQMNDSPLHLLSHIATGNPPGSVQHMASNAGSEGWYNGSYPSYSAADPNTIQGPYAINNPAAYYQNPMSYPDTNYATNINTMYPGVNTDIGFQQALGVQYGQEVDLCAMFMDGNFLPPTGTGSFEGWDEKM